MDNKSRAYEERHFTDTADFAAAHAEKTAEELRVIEADIKEMLIHYSHDNFELYSQLVLAEDMRDGLASQLGRCRRAVYNPYFGRVDFAENRGEPRAFYIGRSSLYDESIRDIVVLDWRTPLANLYYEADIGQTAYQSLGETHEGVMSLKRTYSVLNG
jgi:DNA helicase-2/ATP-dependent DNA helicase PcrA